MRRILAARAIHNVFSTNELNLSTSEKHLVLTDAATKTTRLRHDLSDVAYWATHNENRKLVGYIVRLSDSEGAENTQYSCYVFEADGSGTDICTALGVAAKMAYNKLVEKKTMEKKRKQETKLLLDNIAQLPDKDDPPQVSSDGQFLILDGELPGSAPRTPSLTSNSRGDTPVHSSLEPVKVEEDPEEQL